MSEALILTPAAARRIAWIAQRQARPAQSARRKLHHRGVIQQHIHNMGGKGAHPDSNQEQRSRRDTQPVQAGQAGNDPGERERRAQRPEQGDRDQPAPETCRRAHGDPQDAEQRQRQEDLPGIGHVFVGAAKIRVEQSQQPLGRQ